MTSDKCFTILDKINRGTATTDAPLVIGLGPGFVAPTAVHMVIETMRGHHLGRIISDGSAEQNTGIPGNIDDYKGLKIGDIDPRKEKSYCYTISDKARAISGAVLEGILRVYNG